MKMLGVTWLITDPWLASARLRGHIPRQILEAKKLIRQGGDLVIASKHGWDAFKVREHFPRMIMDVCDDHFDGKWRTHYLEACSLADTITCNSQVMREVIQDHTGIDAVVIDDPYEDPELSPTSGDGVLWFGHSANLPDLEGIREQIKYPLTIIDSRNYTPQALDSALKACRCVIIPTGDKQAKSANRAIKAIRYGKFPVCGPLPAYVEIGLEMDFLTSLDWAMSEDTSAKVKSLQDSIRDRFCPEKVAKDWWKVMS